MTKTFKTVTASAMIALMAGSASAGPLDDLLTLLFGQGYNEVEVEKTEGDLVTVEAENDTEEREIVLNTATGETISDVTEPQDDDMDDDDQDDDDQDDENEAEDDNDDD